MHLNSSLWALVTWQLSYFECLSVSSVYHYPYILLRCNLLKDKELSLHNIQVRYEYMDSIDLCIIINSQYSQLCTHHFVYYLYFSKNNLLQHLTSNIMITITSWIIWNQLIVKKTFLIETFSLQYRIIPWYHCHLYALIVGS